MPHLLQSGYKANLCPCRTQLILTDVNGVDELNVFRLCESISYRQGKQRSINVHQRFCIHNAGVGGSSPPIATNFMASPEGRNMKGGSQFAKRNGESQSSFSRTVPKPCPTCAQKSHLLKQLPRLNLKVITQSTDCFRVRVVTRHV